MLNDSVDIGITQSNEFAQFSKNGKLSLIEFLASFTVGIWSTHVGSNKNREGGKKKYSMSEQAVSTSLDSIYTWHVSKPTRRAVPLSMVHGP